jgi:hypothetical protein
MSAIISLAGLVFLISGLLSIAKVTNVGLDLVSRTQIHTLPFLSTYPVVWVYIALGVVLLLIAGALSRR